MSLKTKQNSYDVISNEKVENETLELQGSGENLSAILESLPLRKAQTILEVGCGSGVLTRQIARMVGSDVKVYGIDISPEHIEFARKEGLRENLTNLEYFVGDIFDIRPEWKKNFDLIYEKYVLMYLLEPKKITEFFNILKNYLSFEGYLCCIEADVNFGAERYPSPPFPLNLVLPKVVDYYLEQNLIDWRCGIKLFNYFTKHNLTEKNVKLVDGRLIYGGKPLALIEHGIQDIDKLIAPLLPPLQLQDFQEQIIEQWKEYLFSEQSFIYTPIFMATGRLAQNKTV